MSTHTPGPWDVNRKHLKYTHEGMYQSGLVIESESESAGIAQLCEWQAPFEAEANARLIAAAPELLEALREASKALTELDPLGNRHDALLIDTAIAKAEGRG